MPKPTDVPTVEEVSLIYVNSFPDLTAEEKQEVAGRFTQMLEAGQDRHGIEVMFAASAWLDRMGYLDASKALRATATEEQARI